MLAQASLHQIRSGEVSKATGYIVVCMAFYPRGLNKNLIDEYRNNLAPDRQLFSEWKEFEQTNGHEEAFRLSHYEERFKIGPDGMESLRRLVDLSKSKDIFLACQCNLGDRCHREMLMLIAAKRLSAKIGSIYKTYPVFEKRIPSI